MNNENNLKLKFLLFDLVTRQTEHFLQVYFGVRFCFVAIKKNARAEFLAGIAGPARPIARRMSVYCEFSQRDEIPFENHGMTDNFAARRITERRATYNGERIRDDFDNGERPSMKERSVHFEDETYDGNNNGRSVQKTAPKIGILRNRSPAIPQGNILQHSDFDVFSSPQSRILRDLTPAWQMQSNSQEGYLYHSTPIRHQPHGQLVTGLNQVAMAQSRIIRNLPPSQYIPSNSCHDSQLPKTDISRKSKHKLSENLVINPVAVVRKRIARNLQPARQMQSSQNEELSLSQPAQAPMYSADVEYTGNDEMGPAPNFMEHPLEFAEWCKKKNKQEIIIWYRFL